MVEGKALYWGSRGDYSCHESTFEYLKIIATMFFSAALYGLDVMRTNLHKQMIFDITGLDVSANEDMYHKSKLITDNLNKVLPCYDIVKPTKVDARELEKCLLYAKRFFIGEIDIFSWNDWKISKDGK